MPKVVDRPSLFQTRRWFFLAAFLCVLDQWSKWVAIAKLPEGNSWAAFTGLQFTISYNRGVAFSLFQSPSAWRQTVLLACIIGITWMIGRWLTRVTAQQKWEGIGLALILGGALGNLVDRIWRGSVVDFIDFYYGTFHWYNFNLADAFITVGAIILIKTILFEKETQEIRE